MFACLRTLKVKWTMTSKLIHDKRRKSHITVPLNKLIQSSMKHTGKFLNQNALWAPSLTTMRPHWLQGKCARTNLLLAASCMILQNHRRLAVCIFSVKIAALGSLKRVTHESILKISM
jgi:hypothetical protein